MNSSRCRIGHATGKWLNPVPFGTDPMGPHEAKKAQQHNRHLTCLDSNFHRD
jgi:hypothetical protein